MTALWAHVAFAQDDFRPPADISGAGDPQSEQGALALRIDRLEAALRRATGEIEELQNENRRLADQLRKFREDVEFRLSGKQGMAPADNAVADAPPPAPTRPQRHSDADDDDAANDAAAPAPTRPQRRTDVFDPDADPSAPGAPRPLGTTPGSRPLNLASRAPDDSGPLRPPPEKPVAKPTDDAGEPSFVAGGVPFSDSKEQFKAAISALKAGQYADAEAQFKAYLAANPGTANAADAVFYLGETYLQRSRLREAAEQYLKVSTEYPKSSRAPESMMRLGEALARLGNKEQACATLAEVGKRYPKASSDVKRSVDREIHTNQCT